MNIILDTNIVIDAIASRIPFNKEAEQIIRLAAGQSLISAITASTASDVYYIARKHLKDTKETIIQLKKLFTIVDIISVDKSDCLAAFDTGISDYEDSLLAVCTMKWGADFIITRNTKDFINSPVLAVKPDDFLERRGDEKQ
ncbi:DNA-binding protein [Spirochaetia bacterium]|nr:DNA-binding protein [Spirochaetia bacterium]